jgi:lipopolysaccharide/colanic/teichoic acid biosynthesis glycosyltransferase
MSTVATNRYAAQELLSSGQAIPVVTERVPHATRLLEILIAATVLVVTAPVMALVGLIIRRGTPGPALFFQPRVGINGRIFNFVKFRTLYHDARERFPHLYAYQYRPEELSRFKFKIEDDPRVTPQGRWLRKSTLDELPNFWNVLTGDMALVGPRPEIPDMLPYYHGEKLRKFTVRPGVTGLAQISGRGRLSFQDTVNYDVKYAAERSFLLDLRIILRTLCLILIRDGAF